MRLGQTLKATFCVALISTLALPVEAQGLRLSGSSSKSRAEQFARQTRLMDSRLSTQYQSSARLQPGTREREVVLDTAPNIPRYTGRRSEYLPHARQAAQRHGIPEDLFLRLVQQESGWNPTRPRPPAFRPRTGRHGPGPAPAPAVPSGRRCRRRGARPPAGSGTRPRRSRARGHPTRPTGPRQSVSPRPHGPCRRARCPHPRPSSRCRQAHRPPPRRRASSPASCRCARRR